MKKIVLFSAFISALFSAFSSSAQSSPATIGTRQGISYEVVSTRIVYELTTRCGYNDLGSANQGKFKVETLRFEQYDKGKLVKTWTEERKTFIECYIL